MSENLVGRVISDEGTPNHIQFKFQVKLGKEVKAGQFVIVKGPREFVAQITKPSTFNPAFADPRVVQFHERGGPDIKMLYPEEEWTMVEALIVGELADGKLDISGTHPKPGDLVELADSSTLTKIFGLGNEIILGDIQGHDGVLVRFNKEVLFDHVFISGKTGSGKTYSGAILIESALESGLPVIAIDPHGELGTLSTPNDKEQEKRTLERFGLEPRSFDTKLFAPPDYASQGINPFTITAGELSFSDIMSLVGLPGDIQQMILLRSMENLRRRFGFDYDLEQLIAEIRQYGASVRREDSAETTCLRLRSLQNYGIIGDGIRPQGLVMKDTVSILTLPGVDDYMQQIAVSILARKLLRAREVGEIPPFFFYVEEAYLYAPTHDKPPSKDALIKLIRQGRKFGIGLGVTTQQPSNVDNRLYAQSHLKIILRLDAHGDLRFVTPWLGPQASHYTGMLPSFPDGRALISAKDLRRPIIVNIRARKSKHGGQTAGMMIPMRKETTPSTSVEREVQVEEDLVTIINNNLGSDANLVTITRLEDGHEVKLVQWVDKDKWIKINNILVTLGFEWQSQRANSRWFRQF